MKHETEGDEEALLIGRLRGLRPAPLPAEVREQMRQAPARDRHPAVVRWWAPLAAAAGATILLFAFHTVEDRPVSVSRRDSTLLGSTPLAIVERDGRFWEVVEQVWRDEESLFCSTTPVLVRHEANRREIITRPVHFD